MQIQREIFSGKNRPALFKALEERIKKNDKDVQAHYLIGQMLEGDGYSELAKEQFLLVKKLDPAFSAQILDSFVVLLNNENLATAMRCITFVRTNYPDDPSLKFLEGCLARQNGKVREAEVLFNQAVHGGSPVVGTASALAVIYCMNGFYDRALTLAEYDLRLNPKLRAGNIAKGRALLGLNRDIEAIPYLQTTFKVAPTTSGLGRELAGALVKSGRSDLALTPAIVDLSGELHKSELETSKSFVMTLMKSTTQAQNDKAAAEAAKLLPDPSDSSRMYLALADVYDRLNDPQSAVEARVSGLKLGPTYVRGYYRMGQSLERLNRYGAALDFYKKAYLLDSGNQFYATAYARMQQRFANKDNDIAWRLKDCLRSLTMPTKKSTGATKS